MKSLDEKPPLTAEQIDEFKRKGHTEQLALWSVEVRAAHVRKGLLTLLGVTLAGIALMVSLGSYYKSTQVEPGPPLDTWSLLRSFAWVTVILFFALFLSNRAATHESKAAMYEKLMQEVVIRDVNVQILYRSPWLRRPKLVEAVVQDPTKVLPGKSEGRSIAPGD